MQQKSRVKRKSKKPTFRALIKKFKIRHSYGIDEYLDDCVIMRAHLLARKTGNKIMTAGHLKHNAYATDFSWTKYDFEYFTLLKYHLNVFEAWLKLQQ